MLAAHPLPTFIKPLPEIVVRTIARSLRFPALIRAVVLAAATVPTIALTANQIVVHRDPGCGCCAKWAALAQKELKRPVRMIDNPRRAELARKAGVPQALGSCHTAMIDGYAIEGHVPFADVKRLLAAKPRGVRGLAVAGMPMGSPGMEVPGRTERYTVMAFGSGEPVVFARH